MDAVWAPPATVSNGNIAQAGYVQASDERDATEGREDGDEVGEEKTLDRPDKPRRKRGRIAKDPLNQTFLFQCRGAEDLESMLRDYLKDATTPPEHTTVEFHFPVSAAFMVYPFGHSQAIKDPLKRIFSKTAVSVVESLQPTLNPKDQLEKQRAIAKVCVEAVSKADGFKYGFNNNWISKEDQASRFSYFCNDSSLNKARAGNPAASNRVAHKRAQKPVYPCEGTISVKFSATKQLLEVLYQHIPCHETYAARAPIPRKGTRRRILMEVFEPEKLPSQRITGGQGKEAKAEKRRSKGGSEQANDHSGGDASSSVPPEVSQEGRRDSLEPILQLVNSIEAEAAALAPSSNAPPIFQAEKLKDLQNAPAKPEPTLKKRKQSAHERQSIPGTMSGFMDGDEIRMGEDRPTKRQKTAKNMKSKKSQIEQDAINFDDDSIVAPASVEPTALPGQPSELDILKAKLAQAEQRIQRLEAEKSSTAAPPPQPYYYPLQGYHHPPAPHSQQYQYPPQQHWQPHPGYGPPLPGYSYPQKASQHAGYTAAKPAANLQSDRAPRTGFGILKPNKIQPNLPEGPPPLVSGIVQVAGGASAEGNTASAESSAQTHAVHEQEGAEGTASITLTAVGEAAVVSATARTDSSVDDIEPAASALNEASAGTSTIHAPSEQAQSMPDLNTATAETLNNSTPKSPQAPPNNQKDTLASRITASITEVNLYTRETEGG